IGRSARVVVPVQPGSTGKVRIELKGQAVDVLATLADGEEAFSSRDKAIIIAMNDGKAQIARLRDLDEPEG
ncbi:MAG: hypothetical protein OEY14_10470, partial [Myxococcales bacterium]|nr:hypothetical protein [Myxococcales bacterium]